MKIVQSAFILYMFVGIVFLCMVKPSSAVQGQLNYDIGRPDPTVPIPTIDVQSLANCMSKLNTATQSSVEIQQQKNKCQETNMLLNKTMKEAVDQNVKIRSEFVLSLIIVSTIACFFFVTTVVLLLSAKRNTSDPPPISG